MGAEGQGRALHANSPEVPGGLQVVDVEFEHAVEFQAFGRALHPEWAGRHGCRDQEREKRGG